MLLTFPSMDWVDELRTTYEVDENLQTLLKQFQDKKNIEFRL